MGPLKEDMQSLFQPRLLMTDRLSSWLELPSIYTGKTS